MAVVGQDWDHQLIPGADEKHTRDDDISQYTTSYDQSEAQSKLRPNESEVTRRGSLQTELQTVQRTTTYTNSTSKKLASTTLGNEENELIEIINRFEPHEHEHLDLEQIEVDEFASVIAQDSSSKALETCRRTILKPYNVLLTLIGWRRFSSDTDMQNSIVKKCLNLLIPTLIVTLITVGFAAQEVLCFNRSQVLTDRFTINGTKSFNYYRCDTQYAGRLAVPYLLILSSYIYGFYNFRYSQFEHLYNLTEKVFLEYSSKSRKSSHNRLILLLKMIASAGIVWFILSLLLNISKVASLQFTSRDTYFHYLSHYSESGLEQLYLQNNRPEPISDALRYSMIVLSLIGFSFNDLFYIAAIINYVIQCQLIVFLIYVTRERIANNHRKVDSAIKEIKVIQDFLRMLNGGLASQMSLLLFIFLHAAVIAAFGTFDVNSFDNYFIQRATRIMTVLSWFFLTLFIIIPATRLTAVCKKIHNLGIELRTRPFIYSKSSKLDLDSFLLYSSKITIDARLVYIPMKPEFVLPVLFGITLIWRATLYY